MRRRLLPLGLAALLFNPSFAQTVDIGRSGNYEISNASAPRSAEPANPLSLKAALALALGANPELSGARRELEAIEATIIQAQVRPNPELATLIEDTQKATRTTTLQLNQPIELGGKRASRIDAAERAAMPHRRNWTPRAPKFVPPLSRPSSMCSLPRNVCAWRRARSNWRNGSAAPPRVGSPPARYHRSKKPRHA